MVSSFVASGTWLVFFGGLCVLIAAILAPTPGLVEASPLARALLLGGPVVAGAGLAFLFIAGVQRALRLYRSIADRDES